MGDAGSAGVAGARSGAITGMGGSGRSRSSPADLPAREVTLLASKTHKSAGHAVLPGIPGGKDPRSDP